MSLMSKQQKASHRSASEPGEDGAGAGRALPDRNPGSYIPGLDGIRALAVLAVIAYHLHPSWLPGGFLGVGVFFVLSGYLITDLLISEWKRSGTLDLRQFWLRRFRRLLPALFVVLACVTAWMAFFRPAQFTSLQGDVLAAVTYMNNWRFIYHQVSYFESFGPLSPLTHLWSLAVEEQFYIVWPLLLFAGLRFMPRRGLLLGVTLAGAALSACLMTWLYEPGYDPSRVYYGTDTRAFALLLGAALAILWPSRKLRLSADRPLQLPLEGLGIAGFAVAGVMMWLVNQYTDFLYKGGLVLLSVATAAVIAAVVHPASRLGRVLAWQPLRWLGVRSYGIYLWHYPVIILTNPAVNTSGIDPVRTVLQVAVTVGLAALSYQFIEEPIRRGVRGLGSARKDAKQGGRRRDVLLSRWVVSACILLVVSVGVAGRLLPVTGAAAVSAVPGDEQEAVAVTTAVGPSAYDLPAAAGLPPETVTELVYGQSAADQIAAAGHDGSLSAMADPPAKPTLAQGGRPGGVPSGQPNAAGGMQESGQAHAGAAAGSSPNRPSLQGNDGSLSLPEGAFKGANVTAIGDSVLLDVEPYLLKLLPEAQVHAKVGRQMAEAYTIVEQLLAERKLGDVVIVELGTNGAFSQKQLDSLIDLIGDQRKILLVNTRVPRPWEDVVNTALSQAAAARSNIMLVDWFQASKNQDAFFTPDGVHLQPKGAEFYASLLAGALVPDLSAEHQLAANM